MSRKLLALAVACFALASTARADIPYWQIRSGGFLPFVRTIAVDPTNSDVVYIGATNAGTPQGEYNNEAGSGVFRSTDGGATFAPRNNGLGNLLATALVIDPSNTNVLYAGLDGKGVYKTTDAGASWTAVNTGLTDLDVYALGIDPATPTTVFVGTAVGGVFRSVDGGGTWTHSTNAYGTIYNFAIDPSMPAMVYAGAGGGVYRSIDGGVSFTYHRIGDPNDGGPEVRGLAIDSSNPSTLLAAGYGFDSGVWRSIDAGTTWTASSTGLRHPFFDVTQHMVSLVQDPVTPSTFYASALAGMFRSIDGGATWASFAAGLSREDCPAFGTHADGTVYTGSVFVGDFHRLRVKPSGVNHFRCFKASAKGFVPRTLTVSDRFGTGSNNVFKPIAYCTPTDPMGEGVVDPTSHLVCYRAKGPKAPQVIDFLTQRIDGYRGYEVTKPHSICVPATVGVPAAAPRDAYRCMDGPNWSSWPTDFTISDAYGSKLIRQHRQDRLCAPTDLDGGTDDRIEPEVDLRCDTPKGKTEFTPTTVTTTDRFGTLTLRLIKPENHCFQALESRS